LDLAAEKVGFIIQMARQLGNGDAYIDEGTAEKSLDAVDLEFLEESEESPPNDQISDFIDTLNEDEALDLVALMWVGRGTFRSEQFAQARAVAAAEATHATSEYLRGTPLLADFLEDGLEAMGISVEEAEEG
jgi:hypothetical protein